jgi:hypothetical protein
MSKNKWPVWKRDDGTTVSCTEKIKVMQDAFEDGVIMEVSDQQIRDVFHDIVNQLNNPYKNKK